jgi:hypothetical protein
LLLAGSMRRQVILSRSARFCTSRPHAGPVRRMQCFDPWRRGDGRNARCRWSGTDRIRYGGAKSKGCARSRRGMGVGGGRLRGGPSTTRSRTSASRFASRSSLETRVAGLRAWISPGSACRGKGHLVVLDWRVSFRHCGRAPALPCAAAGEAAYGIVFFDRHFSGGHSPTPACRVRCGWRLCCVGYRRCDVGCDSRGRVQAKRDR